MLHIILLILKIIGIVLCVLIGLLLTAILLVLCVPVRYRIDGSFYGKPRGVARVTWLLHILSVKAVYEEQLTVVIRLFGIRILKPDGKKEEEAGDFLVEAMERAEDTAEARTFAGSETVPGGSDTSDTRTVRDSGASDTASPEDTDAGETASEPKRPLFSRIADRIRSVFTNLEQTRDAVCGKIGQLVEKKEEIRASISDPANQKTVKLLFKQLKKLLRHLIPTRGKGSVTFGFEDPYTTGQVLTYISAVYPFVHEHLEITPVFDQSVLEGEAYIRGRIRAGAFIAAAGRMLLDKNFRRYIKRLLR